MNRLSNGPSVGSWPALHPRRGATSRGVLRAGAIASLFLALSATAGARAEDYVLGETLARIDLPSPPIEEYVLRATVPVPPHTYPRPDGRVPFALRDPHGRLWPVQVEVVSRYADDQNGADVVEVLARLVRNEADAPGERVTHELIWAPHEEGELDVREPVATLLETNQAVVLRARDVFGNEYRADLLRDLRLGTSELRVLRDGEVAYQTRSHETLKPVPPVPGPAGTLPHLMGAHSYVTVWDEQRFVSLDLRVHNGHDGIDASDPLDDALGKLYFRDLELIIPAGWRLFIDFEDPTFGEAYVEDGRAVYPLVAPLPGGSMHVMPQQGQFHRRLVLARPAEGHAAHVHLREETLGFCVAGTSATGRELWSWWNPATARFFPQKERLPHLNHLGRPFVREWLAQRFRVYDEALRLGLSGPFPITVGQLGWAHPWGLDIGSAHGGDEIHLYDGVREAYAGSSMGYRLFQLVHRMSTERHPVALYDGDGEAFTLEDWIVQGPNGAYVPVFIWIYPVLFLGDPFGFGDSPDFQRQAVQSMGLKPHYENQLLQFENIDRAHLVRYTRAPKALAWLGNDALAKDDLRMQGELARISYSILPQDPYGGFIYTGLLNDRTEVDANPRSGIAMHRGEGWGVDAMAAAYNLAEPAWRAKTRSWFYDVLELLEDGASDCTGIIQGDPNLDTFHGDYRSRQSISASIMGNAFWSVMKSVFGERDPVARERLAAVMERDLYASISDIVWNPHAEAPFFYVAVGPYSMLEPEFCDPGDFPPDGFLWSDPLQTWCDLAYGYRLTHDPVFLTYAQRMLHQPLSTAALAGTTTYGTVENRVAILALVQELLE